MPGIRHLRLLLLVPLLAVVAACDSMERAGVGGYQGGFGGSEIDDGRDYAAALVAAGRGADISPEQAISLGYLERLRLGLGSPFRLIDYALHDPRLDDSTRVALAEALLARTADRNAYRVDPGALDRIRVAAQQSGVRPGPHHLELIEGAVREARDPRGGELAVRLAYSLASAEGSIDERSVRIAARTASMIRDRELARIDVLRLMRWAEESDADPLDMLPEWRENRWFLVEQPPMQALSPEIEREAMELAPVLSASIRSLGPRLRPGTATREPAQGHIPLLGVAAASLLSEMADSLDYPWVTPVAIALDVYRSDLVGRSGSPEAAESAGERFVERARNEENFAAEYALLFHADRRVGPAPALTALWAAVAMRPYAQEPVWYPGDEGPSSRELEDRYGLERISFDEDIPSPWRPYYRRMLGSSLGDLQRVIPSLDLRGLRVHIGQSPRGTGTLALHDPRTRSMYLPPASGAGTIAHEIAHDIDWQVSFRRYRVRGDYGSDQAVRQDRPDRLATSLRGLTSATLLPPTPGDQVAPQHANRPAEIFARSIDWFVVAALAREGRMNGYLSSVQDDLLTGFGTVLPPDITGSAGAALVSILDEVAPIYMDTREWFLESYGPGRLLTPYDLMRRVLEYSPAGTGQLPSPDAAAPPDASDPESPGPSGSGPAAEARPPVRHSFAAVIDSRDAALEGIDRWVCRPSAVGHSRRLEAARRTFVAEVAGARARGVALERARAVGGEPAARWVARRFYGSPWPASSLGTEETEFLSLLVQDAESVGSIEPREDAIGQRFLLMGPSGRCAASILQGAGSAAL